jgi:bifunctional DNA-binding transcriptional regulator/antitoxin component of YhaV-PrlF toxin-antitoxin module
MLDYRKITKHGQLTLPLNFREKFHLDGSFVELIETDEGLLVKPVQSKTGKTPAHDLIDFLNASGDKLKDFSEQEILELVDQTRLEMRK